MTTITTLVSLDDLLRFQVLRGDDGDVTLGFEGFPWHTHGDLLVGTYGPVEEIAIERFVDDLLHNRSVIAVHCQGKVITDICITDDPQSDLRYSLANEDTQFRHWDGSSWLAGQRAK